MDRRDALAARFAALPLPARRELERRLAREGIDVWSLPIPRARALPEGESEAPRHPLAPAQERIILEQELEPESALYHQSFALRIRGALEAPVFERAWSTLALRHEALRTRIVRDAEGLHQVVDPTPAKLELSDWSELHPGARERRLQDALARAARERMAPFDRAPVEIRLLRMAEREHVLLLRIHHGVSDGWSLGVIVSELSTLVRAFGRGEDPQLPELPIQFGDFARWQRRWLESAAAERQSDYWAERLADLEPLARVLPDVPRTADRADTARRAVVVTRELSAEHVARIRALCREEGLTLYMLLLGVLELVISRYTGSPEVRVGSSVAHRPRRETDGLVGCFVNTIVLRERVDGTEAARAWLRRIRDSVREAIAHQDAPLDLVVRRLSRDQGHAHLFQVFFALLNAPIDRVQLEDLEISRVPMPAGSPAFELALRAAETASGGVALALELDRGSFTREIGERLLASYQALAEALVRDPSAPLARLWSVDAGVARELVEVRQPSVGAGGAPLLLDTVVRHARNHPTREAVRDGAGGSLAYEALLAHAQRLAREIERQGVRTHDTVALEADRSVHWLVAVLAAWIARVLYLPLEKDLPPERRRRILEDAKPALLLHDSDSVDFDGPHLRIDHIPQDGERAAIPELHPEAPAYRLYTSGSTGIPKPVLVSHRALSHYLRGIHPRLGLSDAPVCAAVSSLAADLALTCVFGALDCGGTAWLLPADIALHPDALERAFQAAGRPDVLKIPPALLRVWLEHPEPEPLLPRQLLICGGQALEPDLVRAVRAHAPRLRVINHYGPTEATIGALTHEVSIDADLARETSIPLGCPLDHARAYVLDDQQTLLPDRVPGELVLGGATLAHGYPGRPAETAERFLPDPFASKPGARMYRTGDRAVYDSEARLRFLGRADDQISLHGVRIELAEIEARLRALDTIRDAAVLAHARDGDEPALVAYVAADRDHTDTWRQQLRRELPEVMIPARFVLRDALPTTANLKIDRRALEKIPLEAEPAREHVPPQGPVETALVELWQNVLGTTPIGVHDDFFALGGDSILSLQIIARARLQGLSFTPRQIFENPTIRGLATLVGADPTQIEDRAQPLREAWRAPFRGRSDVEDAYPLSPLQEGLLFHALADPSSGMYVNQLSGVLPDGFDVAALRRAWSALCERHAILRTCFVHEDLPRPFQIVLRQVELPIAIEDWSGDESNTIERRWQDLRSRDLERDFALAEAPLMRMHLVHTGRGLRFLWTRHHLLLDGWSSVRLMQELAAFYVAAAAREPLPVLPPVAPFRRYIEWLEGRDESSDAAFWTATLAGFREPTRIGAETPKGAARWRTRALSLGAERSEQLRQIAREAGLTPNTLLQGIFALLLSRITRSTDVVFGATVAGRPPEVEDVEQILGLFINTLPIRVAVDPARSAIEWLLDLQRANVALREHEHTALRDIRRWSELPAGAPLFDALFVYESYPIRSESKGPALGFAPRELRHVDRTNYPLALTVSPHGEAFELELTWDEARIQAAEPGRWLDRFARLADQMAHGPEIVLGGLSIEPVEERAAVDAWNATAAPLPDLPVHHQIAAQTARSPDAIAVALDGEHLTYRELRLRVQQLARELRQRGIGREDRVALCLERSPELVVSILGVLEVGAAYLPLDTEAPPRHRARMLERAEPALVLGHAATRPALESMRTRVLEVDALPHPTQGEPADEDIAADVSPDQLAYVIFTSGSTGEPKGAALSHRGLTNHMRWIQDTYPLGPDDRLLQKTPYTFDVSVWELLWPLMVGARMVLARPAGHRDPAYISQVIREQRITLAHFVPSMLRVWLDDPDAGRCTSLEHVICIGEALPPELADRFHARLPLPTQLHNVYGPTEASIDVTAWACERTPGAPVPIGLPIANTYIEILDGALQPVGIDAPGELCIGGVSLARGYIADPGRTADVFVPDPLARTPGARLYRTGDLARWRADGALEYLGRLDAQLKLHGQRIEPGEIAAAVLECPKVREATVQLRRERAGSGRLVAYYALHAGQTLSLDALRAHLSERLPSYMVPAQYVELADLPRTTSGKLDARALPAPEVGEGTIELPSTEAERILASAWSEVLGVAEVGRASHFFELGGDSILSLQVVARARRQGLELSPRDVFEHPELAALAAAARACTTVAPGAGDSRTGPAPLTPIQRWLRAQPLDSPSHWNQSLLLELPGGLDLDALGSAWAAVCTAHDAFRLRLVERDGVHGQEIDPEAPLPPIDFADGRSWPESDVASEIEERAEGAQRALDLEHGPLARALYIDLGTSARLLLVAHHLIVDGVSWRTLLDDLAEAFAQAQAGHTPHVPPEPVGFAQWARHLEAEAQGGALEDQRGYWIEQVRQSGAAAGLAHDHETGRNTVGSARTLRVTLDTERTRLLLERVHTAYRTKVDDLVLTALASALIHRASGRAVTLELEGHGRESADPSLDLSRTVGWFTTRYPVTLTCDPLADPGARLRGIKEILRRVPEHGLGYGLLRYLAAEPIPGATPEISYNYLGQLDRGVRAQALPIRPAAEATGAQRAPDDPRVQALDVTAFVLEGQLRLSCSYSECLHREATIAALLDDIVRDLEALIDHCVSPEVGALTPSDVPLAGLSADELAQLFGRAEGIEDVYPVSPTQAGMLFHGLYRTESRAYHERLDFAITGALDADAFESAWRETVARHPALRTAFCTNAPRGPLQVVFDARHCALELHHEDWRSRDPETRDRDLAELVAADHARGFELTQAPLIRLRLVRLEDEKSAVITSHHHAVTDGWSIALLLQEVLERYRASVERRAPQLLPVLGYRRYLEWKQASEAAGASAAERYWRARLARFEEPTRLPGGPDHSKARGHAEHTTDLSAAQSDAIREAARAHGLTLNTVFQGAFARLLSRFSGSDDVVFGQTRAGRPPELSGADRIVGPFIQTLPVRVRVRAETPASAWLTELQREAGEQLEHEHSALAQVQAWSEIPAGTPLFETLLVFENYPVDASLRQAARGPLGVAPLSQTAQARHRALAAERNHYPLTLVIHPHDTIRIIWAHDHARVGSQVVGVLARQLEALLQDWVERPDVHVGTWTGLGAELAREVVRARQPSAEAGGAPLLLDTVARHAHPTREAVRDGSGASLPYEALLERAQRLARQIERQGVQPHDTVALEADRSVHWLVAVLGAWIARVAYLPLERDLPPERRRRILADAKPALLLHDSDSVDFDGPHLRIDRIPQEGERAAIPELHPEAPAYRLYTSGSTGIPKPVLVSHRALAHYLSGIRPRLGLSGAPTCAAVSTLAADLALTCVFGALDAAGTAWLLSADIALRPEALERAFQVAERPDVLKIPPALLRVWLEHPKPETLLPRHLLICGGQALEPDLVQAVRAHAPGLRVINHYGPTEATIGALTHEIPIDADFAHEPSIPLGRPLDHARSYVLDDHQALLPDRVPGELVLGGATLAHGYPGRPAETAERFLPDPFASIPGARMYRTGDRAVYDDQARLRFLGRADDQLSLHGVRIELAEIEARLRALDTIRDAAVLAHARDGDEPALVAYVAADRDHTDTWRQQLRRELPEVMIPARFVLCDALPTTTNLKIDRRALASIPLEAEKTREHVPPQGPVETALVDLWQSVLGTTPIGVYDDFFALGGDSILSLQIIARARQQGLSFTPRQIFESPTIRALAALVQEREDATQEEDPTGAVPLTPIQRWLLELDPAELHHFNQSVLLTIPASLDPTDIERAFERVVMRHAALRMRFYATDEGWQAELPEAQAARAPFFESLVLPSADEPGWRGAVEAACQRAQRSLDLQSGPLLRVLHIRDAAAVSARLLVAIHHLAVDAVSWRVLMDELTTLLGDAQAELPPVSVSAAGWARKLERMATEGHFDSELPRWATRPSFALPRDHARAEDDLVGDVAHIERRLSPELTQRLVEELPGAQRLRTDDLVLCALGRALAELAGAPHAVIECESHGRDAPDASLDLSGTVGWLTVRYPVVLHQVGVQADPLERLRQVKRELREVEGSGLGYAVLRYGSPHREALAALPPVSVSYNNLGQVDRGVLPNLGSLVSAAPESPGDARSPAGRRACTLDVTAHTAGGRLSLRFTYGLRSHRSETIEEVADRTVAEIEALVPAALASPESLWVAADLPDSGLDEAGLEDLLGEAGDV